MHASRLRHRKALLPAVFLGTVAVQVLMAHHAGAAPSPTPSPSTSENPCDLLRGPAKATCKGGDPGTSGTTPDTPLEAATDPLGSLAKGTAEAASWVINKLSTAVNESTQVDFTNAGFLRQYSVVFAASTILTLVLWLLAVAKRAVRGIPIREAITEAIGFLWLTVVASAFTPLVLYTLVKVTDSVTEVIAAGTKADTKRFLGGFAESLDAKEGVGGGPVMLIVVSLLSIVAAAVLWLELLIRAAMLYVGALLGTAVYSGLVDKKLWSHVRRWAGIMISVILLKPVIIIVLGLAGAVAGDDGPKDNFAAVLSGLAILCLSIFASVMIYRFVPGFGDDMAAMHNRKTNPAARAGSAMVTGPANLVRQGINTHAARNTAAQGSGGQGGKSGNDSVASGMAAHSSRTGKSGGSGASGSSKDGGDR